MPAKLTHTGCICSFVFVSFVAGCATEPQHLSARNFQRQYERSQTHLMEQYSYSGESNGRVYMSRNRLPRTAFSKMKNQTRFTEANAVPADFLEQIRTNHPTLGAQPKLVRSSNAN